MSEPVNFFSRQMLRAHSNSFWCCRQNLDNEAIEATLNESESPRYRIALRDCGSYGTIAAHVAQRTDVVIMSSPMGLVIPSCFRYDSIEVAIRNTVRWNSGSTKFSKRTSRMMPASLEFVISIIGCNCFASAGRTTGAPGSDHLDKNSCKS